MQEPMKRSDSASAKSEDLKSEVGADGPARAQIQFRFEFGSKKNLFSFFHHRRCGMFPHPVLPLHTRLHQHRRTGTSGEGAARLR